MENTTRTLYKVPLIFFCLIPFIWNCTDKTQRDVDLVKNDSDSVLLWVKKSRDLSVSKKDREQWLKKAYESAYNLSNDTLKSKYFSRISLSYLKLEDSAGFRNTNGITMKQAKKVGDSTTLAASHWDLGIFFRGKAQQDSAYYHYAKAQKIYSDLKDNYSSGRMLYNMAVVRADIKDYTGSEITTIRAIELLKPLDKYKRLYNCYNNLGAVSNRLKEYNRAIEYHEVALEYLEKIKGSNTLKLTTLNNIGVVYQEQEQYKKAIPYFIQVLEYDSLYFKNTGLYARALNNLAYNSFKSGKTINTQNQLQKALRIWDSIADYSGMAVSNYNLAEYYLYKNDTATALTYIKAAKNLSLKNSNNNRLLKTLRLFTQIDPKNATAYTQEYINLNDSLQTAERKTRNKFARIRFETDEFIAENQLLARQRQLWIGIAAGLLLLAGAVSVIVYQRIKNQRLKFQQQQQENNQEIFDLMLSQKKKVEEGKQIEQKRISEELHDSVVGQMHSIRVLLLALNQKTTETAIQQRTEVLSKLQELQEEVRTISHELNDASYQKIHNFINSIQDLLNTISDTAHMKCQFYYDDGMDWDQLNGEVKINLYRIIQESLQNCVKHAKADEVVLNFETEDNVINVSLVDNGVGFDTKKGKRGIGLKNITSRIQKINGTWDIKSKVGEGTTVTVLVPFEKTSDPNKDVLEQEPTLEKA